MLEAPVELFRGVEEHFPSSTETIDWSWPPRGFVGSRAQIKKSGLEEYFHHIEIVSDKTPKQYLKLGSIST